MAYQTVNTGSSANDGTGDQLRTAFDKINDNFSEVYAELGGTSLSNVSITANTISTDDANGSLTIAPNGSGTIILANAVSASSNVSVTGKLTVANAAAFSGPANTFVTFGAADATPSVATGNLFKTGGAVTITALDDSTAGQTITIISDHAVMYDVTGTTLKGGSTDITTAIGDVTTWISDGTNWYLLSFMDASTDLSGGH
jgi:hypothetical protein